MTLDNETDSRIRRAAALRADGPDDTRPSVLLVATADGSCDPSGGIASAERWLAENGISFAVISLEPAGGRGFSRLEPVRGIAALSRRLPDFDIVHLVAARPACFVRLALIAVLARFFGRRVVLDLRSVDSDRGWLGSLWAKLAAGPAQLVVSGPASPSAGGTDRRTRYIPPSLPENGGAARRVRRVQPSILAVVRPERGATASLFLRTFERVKAKYPRAEMTLLTCEAGRLGGASVVGSGDAAYDASVRWATVQDGTEVERLLSRADVCLSPAPGGMPTSFELACLARGLPCIAAPASSLAALARSEKALLLLDPCSSARMADAIIRLVEDGQLAEYLSARGPAAARRYAWPRVAAHWARLYRDAAARPALP